MKVRLHTLYANQNMTAAIGSVIDVSEEEAASLIASNHAVAIDPPTADPEPRTQNPKPPTPPIETAEATPAPETAEAPHAHPAKEARLARRR